MNNQSFGDYQLMPLNSQTNQQSNQSHKETFGHFQPFQGQHTVIG